MDSSMNNLIKSVFAGQLLEVEKALDAGAKVDDSDDLGRTALMYAAVAKRADIVRSLLERGASPNIQDKSGWTALHFAAQEQAHDVVIELLAHNADLNVADEHGNTPLFRAVFTYRQDGGTIQTLLSHGADPDRKNNYGTSPHDLSRTIANYNSKRFFSAKNN
jgi:ankyrin repeat protein